jgi:zona occludens toxin (predicted ATPase)
MIHAYQTEREAPPFGVFTHESARSFAPAGDFPLSGRWWHWSREEDEPLISEMRVALPQFFDWAASHAQEFDYPQAKIADHRAAAYEYFEIIEH